MWPWLHTIVFSGIGPNREEGLGSSKCTELPIILESGLQWEGEVSRGDDIYMGSQPQVNVLGLHPHGNEEMEADLCICGLLYSVLCGWSLRSINK